LRGGCLNVSLVSHITLLYQEGKTQSGMLLK
jgi:hypothetical protein